MPPTKRLFWVFWLDILSFLSSSTRQLPMVFPLIRVKSPRFVFSFPNTLCALGWKLSVSMPTPSLDTAWEKLRQQLWLLIMFKAFLLLTDLNSDCSGFQFRSWFAFVLLNHSLRYKWTTNKGGLVYAMRSDGPHHQVLEMQSRKQLICLMKGNGNPLLNIQPLNLKETIVGKNLISVIQIHLMKAVVGRLKRLQPNSYIVTFVPYFWNF